MRWRRYRQIIWQISGLSVSHDKWGNKLYFKQENECLRTPASGRIILKHESSTTNISQQQLTSSVSLTHTSPPAWTSGSGRRTGRFPSGRPPRPPGRRRSFLPHGRTSPSSAPAAACRGRQRAGGQQWPLGRQRRRGQRLRERGVRERGVRERALYLSFSRDQ